MNQIVLAVAIAGLIFLGELLMLFGGRYLRKRHSRKGVELKGEGLGALEGALFGLMGLILAFCFSGAGARFDARMQMIVAEANCIGTAYLRLDLLSPQRRADIQEQFRQYVDARLGAYRAAPDLAKAKAEFARAAAIQGEIWTRAIAACKQDNLAPPAVSTLLPALNEMFDIANTRYMALQMHPPVSIYCLMAALVLICSLLAGFRMGESQTISRLHVLAFAALVAVTVYVTIDLEFPRLGIIQVTNFDQAIADVRAGMGDGTAPSGTR